jgi:hypothetical protein
MAQKPFMALVIPAVESTGQPPGHVPPGQAPGGPPGQQKPEVTPPIVIEPPEIPDVPEGSRLILVWDGDAWQWRVVVPGTPTQPIAPTPAPKR